MVKKSLRFCKNCLEIMDWKLKNKKFCSKQCYDEYNGKISENLNGPQVKAPSITVGAMNELLVASELMRDGFYVFRALSFNCSCDLIALDKRTAYRIEVTTGTRSATSKGNFYFSQHDPSEYDYIAVVFNDKEIQWLNSAEEIVIGIPKQTIKNDPQK